jgi:hypothetical protein
MDITPEDPDVIRKVLAKLDELSQRLDRVESESATHEQMQAVYSEVSDDDEVTLVENDPGQDNLH